MLYGEEPDEAEVTRVREVYDHLCRKLQLLPLGLFKRQLGANNLDLRYNPLGDEAVRALSIAIEVGDVTLHTHTQFRQPRLVMTDAYNV